MHSFRGGGSVKLSNTIVIDMSNLVESGHTARTLPASCDLAVNEVGRLLNCRIEKMTYL